MANDVQKTQEQLKNDLIISLGNATSIVTKSYLCDLGDERKFAILKPSFEDCDIDISDCGKFYKLTKLVFNKEESFLDKLTTIVNVVTSIDCSLVTMIKSNGVDVEYYIGIISKNCKMAHKSHEKRRKADVAAFRGALTGNLIGSTVDEISIDKVQKLQQEVFGKHNQSYASVSGVVALRDKEEKSIEKYVQGIENLVDSLKG